MTTSIVKKSKSFFVKLLVGIITLPFIFWGMGDVFRGGNQNVIASIDSKKLNTQDFINYINRLNLNENEIKNFPNSNLLERILSEYIGKKVMALEIENQKIMISDKSLSDIIKNDKLFFKDNRFSRTEYEKFLLKAGVSAPSFESNIAEQESKRQFLSYLTSGILIPDTLIEKEYKKENQVKKIKYIDLNNYHSRSKLDKEKIKEIYEENKNFFINEFKTFQFAEIAPEIISGNTEYDERYFKKLDVIENNVLDGQLYSEAVKENNLKSKIIKNIDKDMKFENGEKTKNIEQKLFKQIFIIKNEKSPKIIKFNNKFYLVELISIKINNLAIDNPKVIEVIESELIFKSKLELNKSISKDISLGGFDNLKMQKFASDNNLVVKDYEISSLKQNEIFTEGIIKRIFLIKDGDLNLISDSTLTKNFLVLGVQTQYQKLKKDSNEFEQYQAKAKLNIVNKIYRIFDLNLNQKYNVELNQRTIDRVKNSF